MLEELKVKNENIKLRFGVIKESDFIDGMLQYIVFVEGYHSPGAPMSSLSSGFPVFSAGVNTKRYSKQTRVLLLIEGNDFSTVYVIGEVDDPNKKDTSDPGIQEGQYFLGSINDKSGLVGPGSSSGIKMWSDSSLLSLDGKIFDAIINDKLCLSITSSKTIMSAGSSSFVLGTNTSLLSEGDVFFGSKNGSISTYSLSYELNSEGNVNLNSFDEFSISSRLLYINSSAIKMVGLSSSVSNPTNPIPSPSIDISSLSGNIQIVNSDGSIEMSILSPVGVLPPFVGLPNKISLSIGLPLLEVCQLQMNLLSVDLSYNVTGLPLSSLSLSPSGADLKITPGGSPVSTAAINLSITGSASLNTTASEVTISPAGMIVIGLKDPTGLLAEPAVKGKLLNTLLQQLIVEIATITVPTALGPSGVPLNASKISALANQLELHLSQIVKVT